MAERRPLVRVDGELRQLPDGDTIEGAGSIPEAPEDGKTYGRKDGTWVHIYTSGSSSGSGGEILVTGSAGPTALTTNDETDWLYT